MKRLSLLVLAASLTCAAFAQDLDTVTIGDQFNVGPGRGNELGTGDSTAGNSLGAAKKDASEFQDYNGTDATGGPIRYINSWAGKSAGGDNPESPVVTITSSFANKDRSTVGTPINIPAIPVANTRPGANGGNTAVVLGDDGGFNSLFFGETNDSDYFVEVDLWCPGLSAGATYGTGTPFEVAGVSVRSGRDSSDPNHSLSPVGYTTFYGEHTFNPDRAPGYSLYYDYQKQEARAVRWKLSNTAGGTAGNNREIDNRNTSAAVQLGSLPNIPQGWHTMRIDCRDQYITFKFDGVLVASISDSVTSIHPTNPTLTTFDYGRPCLYYRENFVASASEKQGVFDNLRAGPSPVNTDVNDWNLY